MIDEIRHVQTENLIPYAKNARTHTDEQVAQIAASIREFGFVNPVLLKDDNTIIAGHGRVMAARKLGLDTVPAVYLSHLTDTQARAYVIADNKLALNAGWDDELLALEIKDLFEADFNVELTGFETGELDKLLALSVMDDTPPESSAKEIDPNDFEMGHRCPRCGFEFDDN